MKKSPEGEVDRIRANIAARKDAAQKTSRRAVGKSATKKKPKGLENAGAPAPPVSPRNRQEDTSSEKVTIDTAVAEAAAKLKDSELAVVENYLADPARNQTAAYLKTHPDSSREAACVSAHRLLRKAKVSAYLDARRRQIAERVDVTPERVLGEIAKIAFANAKHYFSWGPSGVRLLEAAELEAELAAAVAEVSETTTAQGGSVRLKLHNKVSALEFLGKTLELFTDKQKHEVSDTWSDLLAPIHERNAQQRSQD